MPLPATFQPGLLNGANGFRINGAHQNSYTGHGVAAAGDVNGDGYQDLLVGAPFTNNSAGVTYLLFGSAAGFPAIFNLSTVNGTNGVRLTGGFNSERSGENISGIGDINGDGFDDILIGALAGNYQTGTAYILYGHAGAFSDLPLASVNGANGFRIDGVGHGDQLGFINGAVGDVNGDGIDDFAVTSRYGDTSGPGGTIQNTGPTYVIFGRPGAGPFSAAFDVTSLDGTNGFRISGAAENFRLGQSVASAGDMNGDGVGDLIIGARSGQTFYAQGSAVVVFGKRAADGPFAATLTVDDLDGSNGFVLTGEAFLDAAGLSVDSAGDVNGDGLDDLIIGAPSNDALGRSNQGAAYIVFGRAGGFAALTSLASLDATTGVKIVGRSDEDNLGWSVAGLGDFNSDGFDDIVVGARRDDQYGYGAGAAYVIFGRATFGATLDVNGMTDADGMNIYPGAGGFQRFGGIVASAGDLNHDGVGDLIVGGEFLVGETVNAGAAIVIYGVAPTPVNFTGGMGDESASGGLGADNLSGGGGKDTLNGLAGDDILDGGDGNDLLNGGDGADDLIGGLGGDTLFGDAGADELSGGDGADKLYGGTGADLLNGGLGNDRMDGQADIDTLNGGLGNDYLDGGLGADIMSGGADNDVYIVDNAGDQTLELAGEGYDIVRTTLTWTLASEIEGLELQAATDAAGTGNSGANNLQGNGGNNLLSGLAGVDTINGNDGDDIIVGGVGNDLLRGGIGADIFRVEHAFGGVLETDQIYDFSTAEGDVMDFSGAYAGTIARVAAFTHHAGEMTLTLAGGITTVRLDIDGNGVAEYQVKINGDVIADYGGWLL
ncbi:MAG: hypothetical protein JWR84_4021 [Caulobacter sp.]|nr:hypothetical protein [Caulobacter sp.]